MLSGSAGEATGPEASCPLRPNEKRQALLGEGPVLCGDLAGPSLARLTACLFLRAGGEIGLLVWGHSTVQDTVLSPSQDQLRVPSKPKPSTCVRVSEENKFRIFSLRVQALAFLASAGGSESHSSPSLSLASLCHRTGW